MRERSIIHLNVADFAVAVERCVDSRLRGRPVIIAAAGAARARVYDMSEEAFQGGVRKGMPLGLARRRCRDARVLPPHWDRYERAMAALVKQALPYSPLIEPGEDDGHLFLDVTGAGRLFGPSMDIAWRLRKEAKADMDLDPIWSVAPNKLVAKVATRLVKPDGEYIVGAGEEKSFLGPLPMAILPGLESGDLARLREFNLTLAGQVAALDLAQLGIPFGKRAPFLYETVRGVDSSPVLPVGRRAPRVIEDHEFGDDTNEESVLEGALYSLVERLGCELRRRRLAARRIALALDYSDGVRRIRQGALRPASANDITLFAKARKVLRIAWTRRVRIRHLRLICDRLVFPPAQLDLFAADRKEKQKREGLVIALDGIRQRFGPNAIRVGRTMAA